MGARSNKGARGSAFCYRKWTKPMRGFVSGMLKGSHVLVLEPLRHVPEWVRFVKPYEKREWLALVGRYGCQRAGRCVRLWLKRVFVPRSNHNRERTSLPCLHFDTGHHATHWWEGSLKKSYTQSGDARCILTEVTSPCGRAIVVLNYCGIDDVIKPSRN